MVEVTGGGFKSSCVQAVAAAEPSNVVDCIDTLLRTAGVDVWDRSVEAEVTAVQIFHCNHFSVMRSKTCHIADAFSKGMLCLIAKHLGKMVCRASCPCALIDLIHGFTWFCLVNHLHGSGMHDD